jgi:hypothetical protein
MQLETLGHASLALGPKAGAPLLITDPWLTGSCYWRAWWLENEPSPEALRRMAGARYCYLTHEHPDHFHTDTIRALGAGPKYLSATFQEDHIGAHLRREGRACTALPPNAPYDLGDGVVLRSIPCFGDDSILVVETPDALIVNLNDARPTPAQFLGLRRLVRARGKGRLKIALSNYSSAGIANSCFRGARRLELVSKRTYVRYASTLCGRLGMDFFMPFASQAVFRRWDNQWASDFRVRFEDLQRDWSSPRTSLLPPYATLDLTTGTHTAVDPADYRRDEAAITAQVNEQRELESHCEFTDADERALEAKLRSSGRRALAVLCPRGLGFDLGDVRLTYRPWTGRIERGAARGSIVLALPKQALKEAVANGYLADLCIPMFTEVHVDAFTDARAAVALFMLLLMNDVGATRDRASSFAWLRQTAALELGALRLA